MSGSMISGLQAMGQNQTKFSQQMGQAYNPAAQFMPDMTQTSLLGKKDEKKEEEQPYMWGKVPEIKPVKPLSLLGSLFGGTGVSR